MTPYYADESVRLFHGDCRDVLSALVADGFRADVAVTDPPYGETSLSWDRWPDGWPEVVATATSSLWCFGSLRMFLERRFEFAGWALAGEVVDQWEIDTSVWEKPNGSGASDGRFLKVHELAVQWYRGPWDTVYREQQREQVWSADKSTRRPAGANGHRRPDRQTCYTDDGTRLVRSIQRAPQMRYGEHGTEKPMAILAPKIAYSCPPGGTVLDIFAGSGSTLDAARCSGRKAVGIEASEQYCEVIARRLSQGSLFGAAS